MSSLIEKIYKRVQESEAYQAECGSQFQKDCEKQNAYEDIVNILQNNKKLKPCPFCGGKATVETNSISCSSGVAIFYFAVRCRKCDSTMSKAYGNVSVGLVDGEIEIIRDDRQKAFDAWNRRATDADSN